MTQPISTTQINPPESISRSNSLYVNRFTGEIAPKEIQELVEKVINESPRDFITLSKALTLEPFEGDHICQLLSAHFWDARTNEKSLHLLIKHTSFETLKIWAVEIIDETLAAAHRDQIRSLSNSGHLSIPKKAERLLFELFSYSEEMSAVLGELVNEISPEASIGDLIESRYTEIREKMTDEIEDLSAFDGKREPLPIHTGSCSSITRQLQIEFFTAPGTEQIREIASLSVESLRAMDQVTVNKIIRHVSNYFSEEISHFFPKRFESSAQKPGNISHVHLAIELIEKLLENEKISSAEVAQLMNRARGRFISEIKSIVKTDHKPEVPHLSWQNLTSLVEKVLPFSFQKKGSPKPDQPVFDSQLLQLAEVLDVPGHESTVRLINLYKACAKREQLSEISIPAGDRAKFAQDALTLLCASPDFQYNSVDTKRLSEIIKFGELSKEAIRQPLALLMDEKLSELYRKAFSPGESSGMDREEWRELGNFFVQHLGDRLAKRWNTALDTCDVNLSEQTISTNALNSPISRGLIFARFWNQRDWKSELVELNPQQARILALCAERAGESLVDEVAQASDLAQADFDERAFREEVQNRYLQALSILPARDALRLIFALERATGERLTLNRSDAFLYYAGTLFNDNGIEAILKGRPSPEFLQLECALDLIADRSRCAIPLQLKYSLSKAVITSAFFTADRMGALNDFLGTNLTPAGVISNLEGENQYTGRNLPSQIDHAPIDRAELTEAFQDQRIMLFLKIWPHEMDYPIEYRSYVIFPTQEVAERFIGLVTESRGKQCDVIDMPLGEIRLPIVRSPISVTELPADCRTVSETTAFNEVLAEVTETSPERFRYAMRQLLKAPVKS